MATRSEVAGGQVGEEAMAARAGGAIRRSSFAVLVLALALLGVGIACDAWPWVVDDAFISLRYSRRLLDGHGLTWTDGEAVEGYSNLAWVLLCAGLGWLGIDLVLAARLLGIGCTVATLLVLLRSRLLPDSLAARLCAPVMAALATTAVWAVGGLEAPLLMLTIALAMAGIDGAVRRTDGRWRRSLLGAGAALAVGCWTRPDAPLWTALAATLLFAARPIAAAGRLRPVLWLATLPIAAVLAQLAFRLAYYGDWMSNTARAKLTSSEAARGLGIDYVTSAAVAMRAMLLPCLLGAVAVLLRRRFVLLFAAVGSGAWWLYILSVGGDAFPRGRLLLPSLAPLTVLAAHGVHELARRGPRAAWAAVAVALGMIGLARYDAAHPDGPRQRLSDWEWLGYGTGEWLGRAFAAERPLLAVDAAGAVPFASQLPCLDMLGLCDRTIASSVPPPGTPFVTGHHRANGAYVLSRRPDLVMFGVPPGTPQPQWLGGRQLEAEQEFRDDYRALLFQTGTMELRDGQQQDLRITVWGHLDGRIGAVRDGDTVRVPGLWLDSFRTPCSLFTPAEAPTPELAALRAATVAAGARWWLEATALGVLREDAVQCELRTVGRHAVDGLRLAPGRWQIAGEPPLPGARWSLEADSGCAVQRDGETFAVAAVDGATVTRVDLVLELPADAQVPLLLRRAVLRRVAQK